MRRQIEQRNLSVLAARPTTSVGKDSRTGSSSRAFSVSYQLGKRQCIERLGDGADFEDGIRLRSAVMRISPLLTVLPRLR